MGAELELAEDYPRPWERFSACLRMGYEPFFSPHDGDAADLETKLEREEREARAKEICDVCVVRQDCLQTAIDHREKKGIWGGLTYSERKDLYPKHEPEPIVHGTRRCYENNCRRPECLAAANKAKKKVGDESFPRLHLPLARRAGNANRINV